jgi:hypothetical protein
MRIKVESVNIDRTGVFQRKLGFYWDVERIVLSNLRNKLFKTIRYFQ